VGARAAVQQHLELAGTHLNLRTAELASSALRDPEEQRRFVGEARSALADDVHRCSRYACANARTVRSWKSRNGDGEWVNALRAEEGRFAVEFVGLRVEVAGPLSDPVHDIRLSIRCVRMFAECGRSNLPSCRRPQQGPERGARLQSR
jgi:hypothetical protein